MATLTAASVAGCATGVIAEASLRANASVVRGGAFEHWVVSRPGSRGVLHVFIEGDGTPWIEGRYVAADPTPRNPLALRLLLDTPGPAAYIGRPCYFELRDPACGPEEWTDARFSAEVVDSMTVVIDRVLRSTEHSACALIGYSGGGALAMLVAKHLQEQCLVVTIAGVIDVDAWTRWHGYLPLSRSLNPIDSTDELRNIRQIHMLGVEDTNVPPALMRSALDRLGNAEVWQFDGFGHVCCWEDHWTEILERVDSRLAAGTQSD
jgi:pimeloyl-ACP methyl ester carboxylesterase